MRLRRPRRVGSRAGLGFALVALTAVSCDFTLDFHRDASSMDAPGADADDGNAGDAGSPSRDASMPSDGCVCPTVFDPVCGLDGVTYQNECWAICAGSEVECDRACPCVVGQMCGGLGNIPCPPDFDCLDDLSDECSPNADGGGEDCPGVCAPADCSDGIPCPEGYECVTEPGDDCNPAIHLDCQCKPE